MSQGLFPYRHGPFPEQGGLCGVQPGFPHLPCGVFLHAPDVFQTRLFLELRLVPQRGGIRVRRFFSRFRAFFCAAAEAVPAATEVAAMAIIPKDIGSNPMPGC
ncbi:MAG: hypothetical protein ACLU7D_08540 [Collinsella sp.]